MIRKTLKMRKIQVSNCKNNINYLLIFFIERIRRSKNEQDGRNYKCDCGKSYLSQPALNNHILAKHPERLEGQLQKGRGRPRKYPLMPNDKRKYENYFNKDGRNPIDGQYIDILSLVQDIFSFIYESPISDKLFSKPKSYKDNPILNNLVSQNTINKPKNEITCDEVFYKYLNSFMNKTNRKYFSLMVKFVLLFRECYDLSKNKGKKEEERKAVTDTQSPEELPDFCNEFFGDFLELNDFFGINDKNDRNELIEIIQHFCNWLFKKEYTKSKLSLVS